MLVLLHQVQDTLGRTSELAGVIPSLAEILWDLESPAYVEIYSERDNLLLARGEKRMGWVLTEMELSGARGGWDSPLRLRSTESELETSEGVGTDSLLSSPAMLHLAAGGELAERFVGRCAENARGSEDASLG